MNLKIVTDSSADIFKLDGIDFASAPLKIATSEHEYVDNEELDVEAMAQSLKSYNGRSTTSCPNTSDWLKAFGDAENIVCITITSSLSGSYNSALLAKRTYESEHPDRRVYVLDSLSTGPEMALIAEKIREYASSDMDFDEICTSVEKYRESTALLFMLESMKNLVNNGRVSPLAAKMAGMLGIRLIGKASLKGELEMLTKSRGEKRAIADIFTHMKALGYAGGKVKITHCFNEKAAHELERLIQDEFPNAVTDVYTCGGLCSFYAELNGMIIGFEHEIRA